MITENILSIKLLFLIMVLFIVKIQILIKQIDQILILAFFETIHL